MDHVLVDHGLPDHDDDDVPALSLEAFVALREFYAEQKEREIQYSSIFGAPNTETDIQEDWQLSQFWYDEKTREDLAKIAVNVIKEERGDVALISCPSLFRTVKKELSKLGKTGKVDLYEFDKRFEIFGESFHFYDYNSPLALPRHKAGYYDMVIADPPFLSEECLLKISVTMKYLARDKLMLCTGAVMAPLAERFLNVKKIGYEPKHSRNLGNEFYCYTNFEVGS